MRGVIGSAEQNECEHQLLLLATKLTRQELADMLLELLKLLMQPACCKDQQLQQIVESPSSHLTSPLTTADAGSSIWRGNIGSCGASWHHLAPPNCQPPEALDLNAAGTARHIDLYDNGGSALAVEDSSNFRSSWLQQQELKEAMYHLVKSAPAAAPSDLLGWFGCIRKTKAGEAAAASEAASKAISEGSSYHVMLLKCMMLLKQPTGNNGMKASSTAFTTSTGIGLVAAEQHTLLKIQLQLLSAQLAVKTKRWREAQQAAAAAELLTRHIVST